MSRKRSRDRSRGESRGIVSRRKVIGALAAGGIGVGALESTGAFSSIDSQRDISVVSADDDEAFVGITGGQASGSDGDTVTLFQLINQFDQPLTSISAMAVSSGNPIDPQTIQTPDELPPGSSGELTATIDCNADAAVEIQVAAAGANQRVEFTRTAQITCENFDVCAPRDLPAGCVINEVPNKSTDCSVVIDTPNQIDERISGNTTIGGAAEFRSESQVDLTLRGNPVIQEYLEVDTPSQIDLDLGGSGRVHGVTKIQTESQLDFDVSTRVDGGVCVENAGEITFSPGGAVVDGGASLTSTDQVTIDGLSDATIGPITIDAAGQTVFTEAQSSTVTGPVSVTAAGQVKFNKLVDISTGPITIDGDGQVNIVTESGSTVDGPIDITDAGGQVTLDFAETEIAGSVTATNESQITISLTNDSTVRSIVDLNTDSQVKIDLTNSSIEANVNIETSGQVTVDLTDSQIDGAVTVNSESQVDVVFENSSITGDLSITTESEATVSDCSSVDGTVSPQSACQYR